MVVRLIGKVEGQDVIFTRLKETSGLPRYRHKKSGKVLMELTAFEKPGNNSILY